MATGGIRMSDRVVIASSGNKHNMLVFSLNEYKGARTFDIRKHYVDKKTNDLKPTKKGITVTQSSFGILKEVIDENHEKIKKWLSSADDFASEIKRHKELEETYIEIAKFQDRDYKIKESSWNSPEFFQVIGEGGEDRLVLNKKHPWIKTFIEIQTEIHKSDDTEELKNFVDQFLKLFVDLLVSFGRARHLCDGNDNPYAEILLDSMMFNWGIFLDRYSNNED